MKPERYEVLRERGVFCYAVTLGNKRAILHHERHSPDGFEFGYGGSGPSDLALSILWDYLGREPETHVYQNFKWQFIAPVAGEAFTIEAADIDAFLAIVGVTA